MPRGITETKTGCSKKEEREETLKKENGETRKSPVLSSDKLVYTTSMQRPNHNTLGSSHSRAKTARCTELQT